jgi:hypothetical protein
VARGDYHKALSILRNHDVLVVELSALRLTELEPLRDASSKLDLSRFSFVSVHATRNAARFIEPMLLAFTGFKS